MTVLVVMQQSDGLWTLGSDSRASNGERHWSGVKKIHEKAVPGSSKPAFLALSGRLVLHPLVKHELVLPKLVSARDTWAYNVSCALADLARQHPETEKTNPVTSYEGFLALGSLCWTLDLDGAHPVDTYDTAGSGGHVALGALYALAGTKRPVDEIVTTAIQAAAANVPTVDDVVQLVHT